MHASLSKPGAIRFGSVWTAPEPPPAGSLGRIAVLSLMTIVIGFGGLTLWAMVAQIESAVPATGYVVSAGKRKTVTLLESGILRELLVHEGDMVPAGTVLLRLDDVQVRAVRAQANVQYWAALARATRLMAESGDQRELVFPDRLIQAAQDPSVAAATDAERTQFRIRWGAVDASVRVQERKIAQTQAQIGALRAQMAASGTRFALMQEELRSVDFLLARGLSTRPHQLELRRAEAEAQGQVGQFGGQIAEAQQAIAGIELDILNTAQARRAEISRERAETQAALADAEQRLHAAEDQLQKRVITAPEPGVVTDLKFFTPGSSIAAGQPVLDLVPATTGLLIEGTVAPGEVEHLAIGQRVNVRLTAYKAHKIPVLTGRLIYVGADRQMDASNQPVFLIRAALDSDALHGHPGVILLPGMPADVLVVNGFRSVFDYLVSPITDSLGHAMNEE